MCMYDRTNADTLDYHGSMLMDSERIDAFRRAIDQVVRPGDVVLDIGCGTGILSLFACRAGAGHVYAVEQGPIIEIARRVCHDNGYQERVTFFENWSARIDLSRRADVLLTETIGNAAFDEGILGWVIDARKRLVVEGGRVIPCAVELWAAPVQVDPFPQALAGWRDPLLPFDFSVGYGLASNNLHPVQLEVAELLGESACLSRVDLGGEIRDEIEADASFVVSRAGRLHGVGLWFLAELAPGIILSNAPPNPAPSWVHWLLPAQRRRTVTAGDRIDLHLRISENGCHWSWSFGGGSAESEIHPQTTRRGQLTSLRPLSAGSEMTPKRTQAAQVDLFILQAMDGRTSMEEIVHKVGVQFPDFLGGPEAARARVLELCDTYRCLGPRAPAA